LHNYNHKKLIEIISRLDALPTEQEKYAEWIKAEPHLAFLRENARSEELVVYANAEYTFVDSVIVPNDMLAQLGHSVRPGATDHPDPAQGEPA
jgi:hypothetical protein